MASAPNLYSSLGGFANQGVVAGLGGNSMQLAQVGAGAAVTGVSGTVGSSAVAAGTITAGTLAAATAGAGVVLAVAFTLWSQHIARVKGATSENDKLKLIVPGVQQAIQMVFNSLNQGTMSPDQAMQFLQKVQGDYWAAVASVETGPGQAGGPNTCDVHQTPQPPIDTARNFWYAPHVPLGGTWYSVTCDKAHTASTCVGCNAINNWVAEAMAVIQQGGGTAKFNQIFPSKYGFPGTQPWSATYTPPSTMTSVEGFLGSFGSAFGNTTPGTASNSITASIAQQLKPASLIPLVVVGVVVAIIVSRFGK